MIDVVATIDGTAVSPHFCTHWRPASAIRSVEESPAAGAPLTLSAGFTFLDCQKISGSEYLRTPWLGRDAIKRVGARDAAACNLLDAPSVSEVGEREAAEVRARKGLHVEPQVGATARAARNPVL